MTRPSPSVPMTAPSPHRPPRTNRSRRTNRMTCQPKGDIHKAISFGRSKIGHWGYDHDAYQATRFGQQDKIADCSGFVSRCLWEGGMPRMNCGFGESSNAMAAWARRNPQYRLPLSAQNNVFGCVIVYGGLGGA